MVLLAPAGCGEGTSATTAGGSGRGSPSLHDYPDQQPTKLRISTADCAALAAMVAKQVDRPVRPRSEPTPPNSRCEVQGQGVHVSISLDTAYAARQRYENRMAEQVQFNAADPRKVPHHVAGVGDRAAGEHFASWIPAYSTLYAVRGNRWLTLAYSASGETRPQRLAKVTVLARRAFRLTAR
ncbi:MAG: hypothetical protein ACTHKT_06190 [Solirubrobacterales bacterium]